MLRFDFLHLKQDKGDIKVFGGVFGDKRLEHSETAAIIIIIIIDLIDIRTATYPRQSLSPFMFIAASPAALPFAS